MALSPYGSGVLMLLIPWCQSVNSGRDKLVWKNFFDIKPENRNP